MSENELVSIETLEKKFHYLKENPKFNIMKPEYDNFSIYFNWIAKDEKESYEAECSFNIDINTSNGKVDWHYRESSKAKDTIYKILEALPIEAQELYKEIAEKTEKLCRIRKIFDDKRGNELEKDDFLELFKTSLQYQR